MKQAEAGARASRSEPRRKPAAARSEPGEPTRSRPDAEANGRTGRNSCSARPEAAGSRPIDRSSDDRPRPNTALGTDVRAASTPVTTSDDGLSSDSDESVDAAETAEAVENADEAKTNAGIVEPSNIIVLCPPTNIIPFPLPASAALSADALASTGTDAIELALATGTADIRATLLEMPTPTSALHASAALAGASDGLNPLSPGFEAVSERERLALQLRLAIERLEAGEDEAPRPDAAETAADAKIVPL